MNTGSSDTLAILGLFDSLFARKPVGFTRTPETLDQLQTAWFDEGYRLVQRDRLHGENVLVMAKRLGAVRAAIDLGAERAWGVLP